MVSSLISVLIKSALIKKLIAVVFCFHLEDKTNRPLITFTLLLGTLRVDVTLFLLFILL